MSLSARRRLKQPSFQRWFQDFSSALSTEPDIHVFAHELTMSAFYGYPTLPSLGIAVWILTGEAPDQGWVQKELHAKMPLLRFAKAMRKAGSELAVFSKSPGASSYEKVWVGFSTLINSELKLFKPMPELFRALPNMFQSFALVAEMLSDAPGKLKLIGNRKLITTRTMAWALLHIKQRLRLSTARSAHTLGQLIDLGYSLKSTNNVDREFVDSGAICKRVQRFAKKHPTEFAAIKEFVKTNDAVDPFHLVGILWTNPVMFQVSAK